MADIAKYAGVAVSTVCDVLRQRQNGKVKISDETKNKILAAVKELDYRPQASARALVTGKTRSIGFVLSSKTPLGLANHYFASIMAGVEKYCKETGYNLLIGTNDLTTTKNFIAPDKLRSRSVDGLVVCGPVENEIVKMFITYGIPFVLVGETAEYPREEVLSVAEDMPATWYEIFDYLYKLRHRNIFVGGVNSKRVADLLETAIKKFKHDHSDKNLIINRDEVNTQFDQIGYAAAYVNKWEQLNNKFTATIGHGHWCVGFLKGLSAAGYKCPQQMSIISTTDDVLCQYLTPSITTYCSPVYENGYVIAKLLIEYIEGNKTLDQAKKDSDTVWKRSGMIVRESTAPFE